MLTFCITEKHTITHIHTHTQFDAEYYTPTIRQTQLDTQTNIKKNLFHSY